MSCSISSRPAVLNVNITVKWFARSNIQILSLPVHIFDSSPFRNLLSGTNPISSYCITLTARAPQLGHVTKRHKPAPPITNENYALLPNHSLVLDHVTHTAILLDASRRILAIGLSISICYNFSSSQSFSVTNASCH